MRYKGLANRRARPWVRYNIVVQNFRERTIFLHEGRTIVGASVPEKKMGKVGNVREDKHIY